MGFTKTFCFCTLGKCKPYELADSADRPSIADNEYWTDIRVNVTKYMDDPICVQHTQESADVPVAVDEALTRYLAAFEYFTAGLFPEPKAYISALTANSSACTSLHIVGEQLSAGAYANGPFATEEPAFDQMGESDGGRPQLLALARLLARAFRRASLELQSAVHQDLDADIAHHFFLLNDLLHEMQGLTLGAVGQMVSADSLGHHPGVDADQPEMVAAAS